MLTHIYTTAHNFLTSSHIIKQEYFTIMSFMSTLTSRKKGTTESDLLVDPEANDKSTSDLKDDKNKPERLDCMTIFIAVIAVLLTLALLRSTSYIEDLKSQRHFRKVLKLIDEQRKSLSDKYKQLSLATNEEELLKQKELIEYLTADISAKQEKIEKLNSKITHHEIKELDSIKYRSKMKTLHAHMDEKKGRIQELHEKVNLHNEEKWKASKRVEELEDKLKRHKEELEKVKEEMKKQKNFVSNFCYDCRIKLEGKQFKGMTCGERLEYLVKKYREDRDNVKLALIKDNPNCRR